MFINCRLTQIQRAKDHIVTVKQVVQHNVKTEAWSTGNLAVRMATAIIDPGG